MIETLLLAVTRVGTFAGQAPLTGATGFFFRRDERLYLVSNVHVVLDEASGHHPDRVEIELHVDPDNLKEIVAISIPLYVDGTPIWHAGLDSGGPIDVAVIELDTSVLPPGALFQAFTPQHLLDNLDDVEAGMAARIVGFPLGFHDTVHHLPVVRQAIIASAFGIRFEDHGYFLTDARTHRGTSGAPVVVRAPDAADTRGELGWYLLGIHAARLEADSRDAVQDSRLSLNLAWYADILMTLTDSPQADSPE